MFYGCTKSGVYEVVVKNETQYDIMVIGYMKTSSTVFLPRDSFLIKTNSESAISKIFPEDYVTSCNPHPYDSIRSRVVDRPDLLINLNLLDKNKYTYTRDGSKSKGFHVKCTAIIRSNDIVPK